VFRFVAIQIADCRRYEACPSIFRGVATPSFRQKFKAHSIRECIFVSAYKVHRTIKKSDCEKGECEKEYV